MHHAILITTLIYKTHLLAFHLFTQKKCICSFSKSIPIFHNEFSLHSFTTQNPTQDPSPHLRKQIFIYTQTYPSPNSTVRRLQTPKGPVDNSPSSRGSFLNPPIPIQKVFKKLINSPTNRCRGKHLNDARSNSPRETRPSFSCVD